MSRSNQFRRCCQWREFCKSVTNSQYTSLMPRAAIIAYRVASRYCRQCIILLTDILIITYRIIVCVCVYIYQLSSRMYILFSSSFSLLWFITIRSVFIIVRMIFIENWVILRLLNLLFKRNVSLTIRCNNSADRITRYTNVDDPNYSI